MLIQSKKKRWSRSRLDPHPIPPQNGEIRLFSVVREEILLLPHFLKHYRKIGVNRFFFVDNGSVDGTVGYLLKQPDCHLFCNNGHFKYKTRWLHELLQLYGTGQWCLIADADELFIYPHWEQIRLGLLAEYLRAQGAQAILAHWIDMYSPLPLSQAHVRQNEDLIETFAYFDRDELKVSACERIFNWKRNAQKVGLFFYQNRTRIEKGQHSIKGAKINNALIGLMLHFGFHSKLKEKAEEAVLSQQYARKSVKYRQFLNVLNKKDPSFYFPASVRYQSSAGCVDLQLMQSCPEFERFALNPTPNEAPPVGEPLKPHTDKPGHFPSKSFLK